MLIIILIVLILLFLFIYYQFHTFRFGVVNMINGGVKCGKTALVVHKSVSSHKKALFKYYFKKIFFAKKKKPTEKPLLYSNIPLKYKYYVPLTTAHLKREKRFEYGSICLLSEISLVANSMCYKDELLNEQIELFIKLFGHETRGGRLYIDTQALGDNHYSVKRSIDTTCWIERLINIPLLPILIFRCRKLMVCDENTINVNSTNPDDVCKTIICLKRPVFKTYDRFCYSVFTDNLEKTITKPLKAYDLKARKVPTFRKFKSINVEETK